MKIQLEQKEVLESANCEEIARTLLARFGLLPRKKDGAAQMQNLLLELYERKKQSNKERKPEIAVMPVEDMGLFAGIKRQTMYEYLHRWLDLQILKKTSFVSNGKVVTGYELNGQNIEGAFRKAESTIRNQLDESFRIIETLQNEVKKEKLRRFNESNTSTRYSNQQHSSLPAPDENQSQDAREQDFPASFFQ